MANKEIKKFTDMAVGTALFGAGMSIVDSTAGSMKNPVAKEIVQATGTVYAAKHLESVAGIGNTKGKKKGGLSL